MEGIGKSINKTKRMEREKGILLDQQLKQVGISQVMDMH